MKSGFANLILVGIALAGASVCGAAPERDSVFDAGRILLAFERPVRRGDRAMPDLTAGMYGFATVGHRGGSPVKADAEYRVGGSVYLADGQSEPAKPTSHTVRDIEGWTVHIDDRLPKGADRSLGDRTLHILAMRLFAITLVMPADKVKRLQQVPLWVDRTHGKLKSMQYHPSAAWLRENGYDTALAKCVHIPDAAYFSSAEIQFQQPWAVLHELAHAYHDQVLGFDNAEIKAAWQKFRDSGKYRSVLHMNGKMRPHYGLTNPMEFFAEMTETYYGMNDFFPFNRAELRREEPELTALLARIWEGTPQAAGSAPAAR